MHLRTVPAADAHVLVFSFDFFMASIDFLLFSSSFFFFFFFFFFFRENGVSGTVPHEQKKIPVAWFPRLSLRIGTFTPGELACQRTFLLLLSAGPQVFTNFSKI